MTSNPTRTSPVKRGVFVLENILGTPPPPPPPNVPELESVTGGSSETKRLKLKELLDLHRNDEVCSSCHSRMDPIGLAFENFVPLGNWRDEEAGQTIETAGTLIAGERFNDVRELKQILATDRKMDFYRCLSKKMLSYAIGRGLEYTDTHSVDAIIERLDGADGRFSSLILGVVESAPFQMQRND